MKFNWKMHFFSFYSLSAFCIVLAVLISLSLKSARMNRCHRKDSLLFVRTVVSRAVCTNLCTVRTCTCGICLIPMMVFESACVSSHIQEKKKVAAAVRTISVLLLICLFWDLSCFPSRWEKKQILMFLSNWSVTTMTVKTEKYLHAFRSPLQLFLRWCHF